MRYGLERMMFRFSQSDHARQFVGKGAMLLRVWTSKQYRPTKDLDYPRETAIAEKFEAMVNLGITNSRMKDYYDIWLLSEQFSFDGETLKAAIIATFKRRQTALPRGTPVGLSNEFLSDAGKRAQWHAFVLRSRLDSKELSLQKVVERVAALLCHRPALPRNEAHLS